MAKLEFQGNSYADPVQIEHLMREHGLHFEQWQTRDEDMSVDEVLDVYEPEIARLKQERGYVSADVVALNPDTPGLEAMLGKFDREHHHTEDEVRFVVAGEGVFELESEDKEKSWMKLTSQPGDLIVIPRGRRHLFYLTNEKNIRCVRLFKNNDGWEALYDKASEL